MLHDEEDELELPPLDGGLDERDAPLAGQAVDHQDRFHAGPSGHGARPGRPGRSFAGRAVS